ncbi:nitrile hydratase accessory protein [Tistlia consotensis]|uniref:Nitrile hydratase accessory protein n=1 Tax=Tistlia consotensis USBA 355 TaxID=560819 RepID=A0A1Y6C9F8_9PROT|nr:nitrile hydratase accessory protein [Tistlia consotensis]SMF48939.1 nitrile hydratase accessory protein [Tistlia consotensis USBA 355]SNR80596.1 nitrile hydratase accessory protein [Tistlia consotensis]
MSDFRALLPTVDAASGSSFAEPWMARAFALTLALSERGLFNLKDFQAALIEAVGRHEKAGCIADETDYYTRWVEALSALLRARGLLDEAGVAELEARILVEAAARREHQHLAARDEEGRLRIAPVAVA